MNRKGQSRLLEWTGERYLPWIEDAAIGYEHIHRYAYATQFVRNKRVLDLACGEGYGSYLLAKTATSVMGVDIDETSIKHARNKYIKQNLEFKAGSITEVPIGGEALFDVAVCFEAIEHIEDHPKLLSEVKRLLTPAGVFIVSTPNKPVYTDEPQFNNPFHVHELYFDEFRELFQKHFKKVKLLGQRIYCNSHIWPVFSREGGTLVEYVVDRNPEGFVFVEKDKRIPLYFIAIASDGEAEIDETESALIDVSDGLLIQKDEQIAAHVREQERIAGQVRQLSTEVQGQRSVLAEGHRLAAKLQEAKEQLERDLQKQESHVHDSRESLARERAAYSALAAEARAAIEAGRKELDESRRELDESRRELDESRRELDERRKELDESRRELDKKRQELDKKDARIASLRVLVQQHEASLSHIHRSHGWKALTVYYQLRDNILPEGSKRTEIAKSFWNFFLGNSSRVLPAAKIGTVQVAVSKAPDITYSGNGPQSASSTSNVAPVIIQSIIEGDDVPIEEVTVSVVIPTKNGGEEFRRVLATMANQKGFRGIETIVVDSGSTDETVELAGRFGSKIIKILPEDFSHSYARNLGASHASGEYLLFTVQDALPPSDSWLHELFSVIKSNDVAAVSCAEFPWESADLFYRAITWNHYRFLEVDKEDRIMRYAGSDDHVSLRKNGQLSDLACLISKDLFTKYKYRTDYGEDLDLGLRLIKDGYDIAFLGSTRIIHSHNRPAYYYLKRGYVEHMFLPRIFPDYPIAVKGLDQVIPDVLLTHQVIKSMVEEETWDLQFPCKTDAFSKGVIKRFQAAFTAPSPSSAPLCDGHLVDSEFQDFLDRLVVDHPVASGNARRVDGDLSEAVQSFTKMILAYMEDSYELVDEHVTGEFRLSVYKMFAYLCGGRLAQCSLSKDDGNRRKREQIHSELTRGV